MPKGVSLDGVRFEATAFFFDGSAYVTVDTVREKADPGGGFDLELAFDSGVRETFRLDTLEPEHSFYFTIRTPPAGKAEITLTAAGRTASFTVPVERGK
jgi:hypothetical protein